MLKISIITATYNSEKTLRETLESILSQKDENVEIIIQDGLSTDSTATIVAEYKGMLWESSADGGLYNAMNKGVERATGDIVGILNSDDFYPDSTVLARVRKAFSEDPELDAVYGDLKYVDADDTNKVLRYWQSGTYKRKAWLKGWMPPHPTFFVRNSVYERFGGFNEELRFAADYELMLRICYKHGIKVGYIPEVLVHMRAGGVSNSSLSNRLAANKEDRLAWQVNEMKPPAGLAWMKPLRKVRQWIRKGGNDKVRQK